MAIVVLRQLSLEVVLLKGVLTIHHIAAAGVASGAIGGKHLGTIGYITSEGGNRCRDQQNQSGSERKQSTHQRQQSTERIVFAARSRDGSLLQFVISVVAPSPPGDAQAAIADQARATPNPTQRKATNRLP